MKLPTLVAVAPINGTLVSLIKAPDELQKIVRLPDAENVAQPLRPLGTIVLMFGTVRIDVILCLSEVRKQLNGNCAEKEFS